MVFRSLNFFNLNLNVNRKALAYKPYYGSRKLTVLFVIISENRFQNHIASGSWQEPVSEVAGRGGPEGAPPKVGQSHGAQDSALIPVHHKLTEWLPQAV